MTVLLVSLSYFFGLMAIGYLVNYLMAPLFGRAWRLFVAPGVILHECAHAALCVLTGARVLEINFWKPSGGHVIHTQSHLPILGPVLIAFAPSIVMTILLFLIAPVVAPTFADLPWTQVPPATITDFFRGYAVSLLAAIKGFSWLTITPWVLIYAMLNVAVTIAPSSVDLHNSKWALMALLILAVLAVRFFGITLSVDSLWPLVATSLILLTFALLTAVIVRLSMRLFRP